MSEQADVQFQAGIDSQVKLTSLWPRYKLILDQGSDVADLTQCVDLYICDSADGRSIMEFSIVSIHFLQSILQSGVVYYCNPRYLVVLRDVNCESVVLSIEDFVRRQRLLSC